MSDKEATLCDACVSCVPGDKVPPNNVSDNGETLYDDKSRSRACSCER